MCFPAGVITLLLTRVFQTAMLLASRASGPTLARAPAAERITSWTDTTAACRHPASVCLTSTPTKTGSAVIVTNTATGARAPAKATA